MFAFTAGLAVLTCVLFGLAPAVRATARRPGAAMKAGRPRLDRLARALRPAPRPGRRAGGAVARARGRRAALRAQLRNLLTLDRRLPPGRRPRRVSLDLRRAGFPKERRRGHDDDRSMRCAPLPGVDGGGAGRHRARQRQRLEPTRSSSTASRRRTIVNFNRVSPGYFKTMGTPLLAGRDFDERDTRRRRAVAIVNESFARKFFGGTRPARPGLPDRGAAGRAAAASTRSSAWSKRHEVHGPARAVQAHRVPGRGPGRRSRIDVPAGRRAHGGGAAGGCARRSRGRSRPCIRSIVVQFDTMSSQVRRDAAAERLMATLTGSSAAWPALIATIGLYGVMSYLVARRRNEIGIRMALGADRRAVVTMVLRESGLLLGAGVLVGAVLAVGAARTASALLFGLTPGDPVTFVKAVAGLAAVAAAGQLPARGARRPRRSHARPARGVIRS